MKETDNLVKELLVNPSSIRTIATEIYENMDAETTVIGVPEAATPLAAAVSVLFSVPMMLLRKFPKNDEYIRNKEYRRCTLIEDVTSTCESVIKYIQILEENNFQVDKVIIVIDEGCKAKELIKKDVKVLYDVESFLDKFYPSSLEMREKGR
jgi:Orotate phosphoribosyltransferase